MIFRNRQEGGRLLARELERYRANHPMVLGLTRGGVPVALEVAWALGADLDIIVARKLGVPSHPEYGIGAIAENGAVYVRWESLAEAGLDEEQVAAIAEREAVELARRVRVYRCGSPMPDLSGRTVVIVDDGVATGATAHAAARAARLSGAARVVLAAPVIAAASVPDLTRDFDDVVAVELPRPFHAVGTWYEQFPQVSDEEVLACLRQGFHPQGGTVRIPIGAHGEARVASALDADLTVPPDARGLVLFVHGSGSARHSPRNRLVASAMQRAGFATLLFDLLTPEEAAEDQSTARLRFDVPLLSSRLLAATRWAAMESRTCQMSVGYFGASTGAAAALEAAAENPGAVAAVVSRGGRPDLVHAGTLARVHVPVLLIVGSQDEEVLAYNRSVLGHLPSAQRAVVRGAMHLFEEPGALEEVARLATGWFRGHLHATVPGRVGAAP